MMTHRSGISRRAGQTRLNVTSRASSPRHQGRRPMPFTTTQRRGKAGAKRASADRKAGDRRPFTAHLIRGLWILFGLAGVVAFAVLITRLTLRPEPGAGKYVHDNTHPGETLRLYLDQPSVKAALLEIGGNLVLLAPLGALLPVLFARLRGPLRIFLAVGLISLCIETVQGTMIAGRAFDADDVILNTAGALAAYLLIGRRLSRWAHAAS
jgi:hypothetical protein